MQPTNPPTTPATYTPSTGSGIMNQQVQNAINTLNTYASNPMAASNLSATQAGNLSTGFSQSAAQAQAATPAWNQQEQQSDITQAQIPQMAGQQSLDYDTFARMFAQDPLGQQQFLSPNAYTPQSDSAQVTGEPASGVPQLTQQSLSQPFAGFSFPTIAAQAGAAQQGAYVDVMKALQDAITTNLGKAGTQFQQDSDARNADINVLQTAAQQFANQANAQNAKADANAGSPGTTEGTAGLFNTLVAQVSSQGGTIDDLWNLINQGSTSYAQAGYNVSQLWALQKDLANKVGKGGKLSGGVGAKAPKAPAKYTPIYNTKGGTKTLAGYTTPAGKSVSITTYNGQKGFLVKDKQTGQSGFVPTAEFDPTKYDLL